ncbi:uncharacterized protein LOC144925711 [Branchiostoma floridae x Branchiostoma belcheri]
MAALAHAHLKHPRRHQENVIHVRSMSSNSDERLPSYLPEDELDACLRTVPSNSQDHFLHPVNPERFTSSDEYGDLYRSSSNSSNRRVPQPGSLTTQYPSYLPESDEDTEDHRQLYSSGRAQEVNYENAKLHARSGRHPSVKTDTRKPLNGVKKSVMRQVSQEENNRNKKISTQDNHRKESSHLSSGLDSLSSYLSNSFEGEEIGVTLQKSTTGSSHKDASPGLGLGGVSIHESVGRLSLSQRTQSGDSVDSCQSAKTAFAQELGETSREKSTTRAKSKNFHMDQLDSSANSGHAVTEELAESMKKTLRSSRSPGTSNSSPQQQVQMPRQQTPMQTHTNTPPMQIPVTSLQADDISSGTSAGTSGSQGQSLGPQSGWSFHLPRNGMRMEVPKSSPSYSTGVLKEDEKCHQDRSLLLRSLLPSQVTSHLSEEDLVKEAKIMALKTALTRLVQEKPSYLDSDPESLLSQLSDLIFQNQENELTGRNCEDTASLAAMSLRSMVSQSLGSLREMLSTASTMTSVIGAGNRPGAMAPSANQSQEHNPSSQHSMTNELLSTIFISQSEATAALTTEQNELLSTLQSATAKLSLVQENIQSEQVTVGGMIKNRQESQQHHHTRLLDILELLCPEFMKHVLVGAAYCCGRCKQPTCMLGSEVLSYLMECVKEGTVLRCGGCSLVLTYILHHHVPRCTERRCLVPYCVHLQTGMTSSVEKAVDKISSETFSSSLRTEIVAQTSGNQNFQWLSEPDAAVKTLKPVLPLGTFGTSILACAKDKYVTVKQMKESCLDVLRRLDRHHTHHIIQFYWVQSAENCQEELQVCTAFEQGGSLQCLLTDHGGGGLQTDRMWQYLQQVVQAVVYLHSLDIVYLAWTADNIVLDSSHQRAKLSNFSYAVSLTEAPDEEACVQAVTGLPPQILAPEVHDLSACHQSDLWGLGCLLFQLREGRLPYPHLSHDHPESIRQKIAEDGELPMIPELWQEQERRLLEVCWQEEAALRPTAQKFQALLARYYGRTD